MISYCKKELTHTSYSAVSSFKSVIYRSRSVSLSEIYLSARHTIHASRLLGRCVRFSGHMWL